MVYILFDFDNKEVMVNPTDEETNTSRIRNLKQEGTFLEYNLNKLKRARYVNLMLGSDEVNKMTSKNATAPTIL